MSNKELAVFTTELQEFFLDSGTLINIKIVLAKMISIPGGLNAYPYLLFFVKASTNEWNNSVNNNNMYVN